MHTSYIYITCLDMLPFECICSMYAHTHTMVHNGAYDGWSWWILYMYIYRCILYVMHLVASKQTPPGSPLHFPALVHRTFQLEIAIQKAWYKFREREREGLALWCGKASFNIKFPCAISMICFRFYASAHSKPTNDLQACSSAWPLILWNTFLDFCTNKKRLVT